MRLSLQLPRIDEGLALANAEALVATAQTIADAGFDSCFVTDHPFPVIDGTRTAHHAWDPFTILASVARETTRVRLLTCLVVLPYRNPFILANAANTLDYVSNGRLILGLGAGYLKSESRRLASSSSIGIN